jgi:hypothetical protein
MDNFVFFLNEGLYHVLDWNAYDHILFLIALAVVYEFRNWKAVLWLITLFTIGHTFSLILATYGVVSVSSQWVEFLIPLTIIITAIVNIFYAKSTSNSTKSKTNLFFALFFGLIHGLGFSSYFKLIIGSSEYKLIPLLEFALGVEIAQIVIVIAILFFGFIFQTVLQFSKRDWILIVSSIVIGIVLPILKETVFW